MKNFECNIFDGIAEHHTYIFHPGWKKKTFKWENHFQFIMKIGK